MSARAPRRKYKPRVCSVCGCDGTESDIVKAQRLHGRAGFMAMQALGGVGVSGGESALAKAIREGGET